MHTIRKSAIDYGCERKIQQAVDRLIDVTKEYGATVTDINISAEDKQEDIVGLDVSVCDYYRGVALSIHS